MEVSYYQDAIEAVTEPLEIWNIITEMFSKNDIRKIGYRHFPPLGAPDADVLRIRLEGFPEDLVERYLTEQLYREDPDIKHAQITAEPFYWDEVPERAPQTERERALQELREQADVGNGIGIPVFGPNGRNGYFAVSIGRERKRLPEELLREFRWVCQFGHSRFCTLLLATLAPRPDLSRREHEILSWVARGKSNATIGEILGISGHTVDAHLRRIFLKLDVYDRITATVRGLGVGLITT